MAAVLSHVVEDGLCRISPLKALALAGHSQRVDQSLTEGGGEGRGEGGRGEEGRH